MNIAFAAVGFILMPAGAGLVIVLYRASTRIPETTDSLLQAFVRSMIILAELAIPFLIMGLGALLIIYGLDLHILSRG